MTAPRFLLDTNILVYLIAGERDLLRDRVQQHEPGTIVTSTLCVAEALSGITDDDQKVALGRLLTVIEPLPFGMPEARRFPDVPFRRGKLDRFIAAHALATGLTIVTNNEADFADIPGLQIENWTQ
ncbi:type II toxin-antitoxin system VapC family toxin [Sphingomonas aquatilis]|uniref:tRNA(fMet)-specific endonuclease VapC n=1 Tax=Sphingomonas aquatilis TaxID=93063 RepID=A0AAW3TQA1_9SPHN|nr:type II toxin-antitoxin system VapC family toxin [Sphingomonas aquatilis]MBB3874736.1 tRNA(fMet)-specific endonuclease VapC [Sphingomonas aquatilis]MCI4655671.1 type II toxin-antitoxin system VapC family toxin [Sphingomonas aquatilis]GEM73431.1 twitching motility protein PilT [Sphingomonas aquatilis NBRC 16722]